MMRQNSFLRRDYEAGVNLAKARREADRPLVDNGWLLSQRGGAAIAN
ncbi:MAG: hypothetical protein ACE5IW_11380 [bacterium]